MTQPIQSTSSYGYTPYDPSDDISRADGSGGAPGNSRVSNQGTEGAPNSANSQPQAREVQCLPELLATGATCGSAYLTKNMLTTAGCVAAAHRLFDCLTRSSDVK